MPTTIADIRARPRRPAVRLPFRVLAGLFCLIAACALVGTLFMALRSGPRSLPDTLAVCKFLIWLPGMLWLTRLFYFAARFAKVPDDNHWPFASGSLATAYCWIAILFGTLY